MKRCEEEAFHPLRDSLDIKRLIAVTGESEPKISLQNLPRYNRTKKSKPEYNKNKTVLESTIIIIFY